jgi:hypothetical protein
VLPVIGFVTVTDCLWLEQGLICNTLLQMAALWQCLCSENSYLSIKLYRI